MIDGAVNASFSAMICLILLVKSCFKRSGVLAVITPSHSSSPATPPVQLPILANFSNSCLPLVDIPPP